MEIKVLVGNVCPKCDQLKAMLSSVGAVFSTESMFSSEGMKLVGAYGIKSIPQVFVDGELLDRNKYQDVLGVSLD